MAAARRRSPRDERCLERAQAAREPHDVGMRAELEVQHGADAARERHDVGVLDVPPVLTQVHRDAVGAAALRGRGGLYRVGAHEAAQHPGRPEPSRTGADHRMIPDGDALEASEVVGSVERIVVRARAGRDRAAHGLVAVERALEHPFTARQPGQPLL